jgi:hypothetical protein
MKKILLLILAISILPASVLAQQCRTEQLRTKLEQARETKDEKMDAISLETELMKSAIKSNGREETAARTRPAVKWTLHPAHLSLPGRMVMTVLVPGSGSQAPQVPKPTNLPLTPPRPAVTIEVAVDREEPSRPDPS